MPDQTDPSLPPEQRWKASGRVRVGLPQSLAVMEPEGWVPLNLDISVEMKETLDRLADESRVPVADVLARAVALYAFAYDSHKEGRRVIVTEGATDPESEIEVIGF